MYGFGDDKHVAHDSVAVMEEILTEYIVDVVSPHVAGLSHITLIKFTVPNSSGNNEKEPATDRRSQAGVVQTGRRKEAGAYGRAAIHAGGY